MPGALLFQSLGRRTIFHAQPKVGLTATVSWSGLAIFFDLEDNSHRVNKKNKISKTLRSITLNAEIVKK